MNNTFRGIRQVLLATYNSLTVAEKANILWFVRENTQTQYGDIYFGSRHYGHFGPEGEDITKILMDAGIIDESGATVNIPELIADAALIAGDGLEISGKTISVVVAESEDNLLEINEAGALTAGLFWEGNDSE